MRLKVLSLALLLAFAVSFAAAQKPQYQYPFQNLNLPVKVRVKDLLSRMTLREKIAVLGGNTSVPRLGVPGTHGVEGLHGEDIGGPSQRQGPRQHVVPTTQFPQSYGLGQTWDPALLTKAAAAEAFEARWAFNKYHEGGLVVFSPNANLDRDPLWGRNEESYGEDPYLTGTLAVAFVKGLQGNNPRYWEAASLMKHFDAYNNETNRMSSSSNFSWRLFHEYYAVPFRMGIEQGGANAFMTSYNAWNGIPMAVNPVLRNVVIKDWRFSGIISTDGGAMTALVTQHHYYKTLAEAAAGCIHAGINQFLDNYKQPVEDALKEHLITEQDIDRNLAGVYRVMIRLGMLDPYSMNPYAMIGINDLNPAKGDPWWWPSHIQIALKTTEESIVLLKNQNHALPLDAGKLHSIAVIGQWANVVNGDWYSGTPPFAISPVEGIRKFVGPNVKITFNDGSDPAAAAALAKQSDVAIVVVGNNPTCNAGWGVCNVPSDGKEGFDRKTMTLPGTPLVQAVDAANPHTIVVLQTSFPYTINWIQAHIPGIVEMSNTSEEQGAGLANVLFGKYDPAGRLTQTWPRSMSQLPPLMDYNIRDGFTYMYFRHNPLYPFGYGLSYTTFKYSDLRLSSKTLPANGKITVSVNVTNTGRRNGDEVVQMYVKHLDSKVSRPIEALKGFERIHIPVGQTRTVTFPLTAKALAYWAHGGWRVEHDHVQIRIGASSADIRQKVEITVE